MIKIHELRIGNTVKCAVSNDAGIYHVLCLDGWMLRIMLDGVRQNEWYPERKIRPIKITKELLEKNGFVWRETLQHWTKTWGTNGVHFIKYDEHYKKFSFQLGQLHYKVLDAFHNLQNLWIDLTGETLNNV